MSTRWTDEEDQYLLANFGKHDVEFLAKVLTRSPSAIRSRYQTVAKKLEDNPPELEFVLERSNRAVPKRLRNSRKGTIETSPKLSKWTGKGNPYSHTKSGWRPDIRINVRSGWEANVLRVLKSYDIPFEFEPRIFTYPIKRGNKAYTPDIYLSTTDEWIEVKGYLDKNSEIKLKRFKKYYPEEFATLTMIISKSSKRAREFCEELGVPTVLHYEQFGKLFKGRISTWEGR